MLKIITSIAILTFCFTSFAQDNSRASQICIAHKLAESNNFCQNKGLIYDYCMGFRQAYYSKEILVRCTDLKTVEAVRICQAKLKVINRESCQSSSPEVTAICEGFKAVESKKDCNALAGDAFTFCKAITTANSYGPCSL